MTIILRYYFKAYFKVKVLTLTLKVCFIFYVLQIVKGKTKQLIPLARARRYSSKSFTTASNSKCDFTCVPILQQSETLCFRNLYILNTNVTVTLSYFPPILYSSIDITYSGYKRYHVCHNINTCYWYI